MANEQKRTIQFVGLPCEEYSLPPGFRDTSASLPLLFLSARNVTPERLEPEDLKVTEHFPSTLSHLSPPAPERIGIGLAAESDSLSPSWKHRGTIDLSNHSEYKERDPSQPPPIAYTEFNPNDVMWGDTPPVGHPFLTRKLPLYIIPGVGTGNYTTADPPPEKGVCYLCPGYDRTDPPPDPQRMSTNEPAPVSRESMVWRSAEKVGRAPGSGDFWLINHHSEAGHREYHQFMDKFFNRQPLPEVNCYALQLWLRQTGHVSLYGQWIMKLDAQDGRLLDGYSDPVFRARFTKAVKRAMAFVSPEQLKVAAQWCYVYMIYTQRVFVNGKPFPFSVGELSTAEFKDLLYCLHQSVADPDPSCDPDSPQSVAEKRSTLIKPASGCV